MTSDAQQLVLRPRVAVAGSRSIPRSTTVAALCTGALVGVPLLPWPIAIVVAVLLVVGGFAHEAARGNLRRHVATYRTWRERTLRRSVRTEALLSAGCFLEPLYELERLVARIEHDDPAVAKHLDLESLLDRHVVVAVAYQRALKALALSDRGQLVHIRDAQRSDPEHDPLRLELCERRLRSHDECVARAQGLADELAIISDLIRLVAQRAACPGELAGHDVIEHCLAELDGRDAAQRLLAAELG